MTETRAFVQARMSSQRFPGKVLAPFRGEPVVRHVVRAVAEVVGEQSVVVATSTDSSDDPLVAYLSSLGVATFRGPLDDVFERFRLCLRDFPCEWILRISADSPLLDRELLRRVVDAAAPGVDLVSTITVRTFPHGQSAELIRSDTLLALDPGELTSDDREHVTPFFYREAHRFRILSIESDSPERAGESLVIDTIEDLRRLEGRA